MMAGRNVTSMSSAVSHPPRQEEFLDAQIGITFTIAE
jgi:hypothetical protein